MLYGQKAARPLKCSPLCLSKSAYCCLVITLWCAEQDVYGAGAVDLVLLGNDDGKWGSGSPYVLQGLSQWDLCVEKDQIYHHAQIPDFPPDRLSILPTVVFKAKVNTDGRTHTHTQEKYEMTTSRQKTEYLKMICLLEQKKESGHTFALCWQQSQSNQQDGLCHSDAGAPHSTVDTIHCVYVLLVELDHLQLGEHIINAIDCLKLVFWIHRASYQNQRMNIWQAGK